MSGTSHTLIPLKAKALREAGIPLSVWTLRDWRKRGRNLNLFTKLGRRVFLILEEWEHFVRKNRGAK